MCVVYSGIMLPLACTLGYVVMLIYNFLHVNIPHNYFYLQYNHINMQDDNVNIYLTYDMFHVNITLFRVYINYNACS